MVTTHPQAAHRPGLRELGSAVVVGVDGSDSSRAAVEWAALEAQALGCSLELIHARRDNGSMPSPAHLTAYPQVGLDRVLSDAAARVVALAPETGPIGRWNVAGGAARHLLDASRQASVLVIGAPHRSPGRPGAGVVAHTVAAQSFAPVVVVKDRRGARRSRWGILAATDGSWASLLAVGAAVERGARTGSPVTVMHVRADRGWAPTSATEDPEAGVDLASDPLRAHEALLARARRRSGVRIRQQVVHGDPARVICGISADWELVVVGSHERQHESNALRLGSVTTAVIEHAETPVMVVGHNTALGHAFGPHAAPSHLVKAAGE